jgi:hypothetical protein
MSRDRSRSFLKHLCESSAFVRGVGKKIVDHVRMVDRELALRFVAFSLLKNIDEYQKFNSMDDFLTEMNKRLDETKTVQSLGELQERKSLIVRRARRWMTEDDEFIAAISTETSSPGRVSLRFDRVQGLLEGK